MLRHDKKKKNPVRNPSNKIIKEITQEARSVSAKINCFGSVFKLLEKLTLKEII